LLSECYSERGNLFLDNGMAEGIVILKIEGDGRKSR